MVESRDVKITVAKMLGTKELWGSEEETSAEDVCPRFKVGEIYMTKGLSMPENWPCSWAWHDIFKEVLHLSLGGEFFNEPGNHIMACCTDGMRPVFYRIEREE